MEAEFIEILKDFVLLKGFQWGTSKVENFLKDKPTEIYVKKDLVVAYYTKNEKTKENFHPSSS